VSQSSHHRDSSRRHGDTPAYESAVLARARVTAEGLFPEGNRWHVVTGANYVVDKRRSVSAGGPVHVGRVLPAVHPRLPPPPLPPPDAAMRSTAAAVAAAPAMLATRRRASALSFAGVSITPAGPALVPRRGTNPYATSAPFGGGDLARWLSSIGRVLSAPGDVVVRLARAGSVARNGSAR